MSGDAPAQGGDLQFDRADYGHHAPPALTCRGCGHAIGAVYYEAGGQTLCEACQFNLAAFRATRPGAIDVLKAIGAGIGAGAAGWLLYYAVLSLSGYEFGLIAIVVGWAVGRAVRWGSAGRGGWAFQAIAVVITYVSIVSTAVPMVLQGIRTQAARESVAASTVHDAEDASPPARGAGTEPSSAGLEFNLVSLALFAALILALPFLQGFSNIMGIAILGFGVFEAWRINRRLSIEITGPFTPGPRPVA